jgi:hypothetical protein
LDLFSDFGFFGTYGERKMPKTDGTPTKGERRFEAGKIPERARQSAMLEKSFRSWFKLVWRGWIDTYEPTTGTGFGFPDCQIVVDCYLFPIELKVGDLSEDATRIFPREVRPAQISWHRRFAKHEGAHSILLIGAYTAQGDWLAFAVSGERARAWSKGYKVGSEAILINGPTPASFHDQLLTYVRDYRAGHFR